MKSAREENVNKSDAPSSSGAQVCSFYILCACGSWKISLIKQNVKIDILPFEPQHQIAEKSPGRGLYCSEYLVFDKKVFKDRMLSVIAYLGYRETRSTL